MSNAYAGRQESNMSPRTPAREGTRSVNMPLIIRENACAAPRRAGPTISAHIHTYTYMVHAPLEIFMRRNERMDRFPFIISLFTYIHK